MSSPFHHPHSKDLKTWTENKTTFNTDFAQFSLYETFEPSFNFSLQFSSMSIIHMLEGKKVMHVANSHFDYHPEQSLFLKPDEKMHIDFPIAQTNSPTRCIALIMDDAFIDKNLARYQNLDADTAQQQVLSHKAWHLNLNPSLNYCLFSDKLLDATIKRLLLVLNTSLYKKEYFFKNALKELLIIITQAQNRNLLISNAPHLSAQNKIAFVVDFIKKNLHEDLSIPLLAQKAMLSKAVFCKIFKHQLGITPMQFVYQERLKLAVIILKSQPIKINELAFICGFKTPSHLIQLFKAKYGSTPSSFKN